MSDESLRPKVGAGVLLFRDQQILLGLRHGAHGSGTWHPPGGHIEYNEEVEETAKREVFEETGMEIHSLQRGPWTNDIFLDEQKHYITVYMISRDFTGEPIVKEPHKCLEWRWFDCEDLPTPLFLPLKNLLKQGDLTQFI